MRIGLGYDSHRFADGERPLVLGGVVFPGERGLRAHSDGDVLIHAIIDALLGAAALGDIGSHFPDSDERWRGADSMVLLGSVAAELKEAGYRVVNLDATVVCERPKILPRRMEIVRRIAQALDLAEGDVSIKGKTNERMDDIGAGLGISAQAVCLISSR